MGPNRWVTFPELSLATFAREAGFDLAIYETYSASVRREVKKRTIDRAVNAILDDLWDAGFDIAGVKKGVYVISLSSPLTIEYRWKRSQVIYIGMGNIAGRIRAHFQYSLFDFMQSLSGANFDFSFARPYMRGHDDYHQHVEWHMLEYFRETCGGLGERDPYPILNRNAGSCRDIRDRSDWWKKPLRNNGRLPRWSLRPTEHSDFAPLD